MGKIKQILTKVKLKRASPEQRAELMRSKFHYLGKNVSLYTTNFGTEPYLISIHDNVICAADVVFLNHDVSCFNIARYLNKPVGSLDKVGNIELFDNCFIGAHTILMPNTSVGKNSIVAAGSIVTKHIPDNEVWGGVPARFIMSVDDYAKKLVETNKQYPWMNESGKTVEGVELEKIRADYFFNKKN